MAVLSRSFLLACPCFAVFLMHTVHVYVCIYSMDTYCLDASVHSSVHKCMFLATIVCICLFTYHINYITPSSSSSYSLLHQLVLRDRSPLRNNRKSGTKRSLQPPSFVSSKSTHPNGHLLSLVYWELLLMEVYFQFIRFCLERSYECFKSHCLVI